LCLGFEGQKQLAIACHQRIPEEIDGIVLALDLRQSRDGNFMRILFSEVLGESQGFGRIINSQGRQVCDQAGEIRSLSASNAALEAENARLVEENEKLRSEVQSALNGSQDFATQQSFHAGSLVREDR
jgi:hypothetical protein